MVRTFQITRFVIVAVLVGMGACTDNDRRAPDKASFQNHKPLAAEVAKSDRVVLYEGLPHPNNEKTLFDAELQAKKTIQHDGFAFYEEPLPLEDADAKELT